MSPVLGSVPLEQEIHDRTVAALEGFAAARATGRRFPADEAFAWALREIPVSAR